jgi:hypothetical protein
VQLALEAGWTMAVLYGRIESVPPDGLLGLPTANELQAADRRKLELDRVRHLLKSLAQMPEFSDSGLSDVVPPGFEAQPEALKELNLSILCGLAAAQSQAQLAYELGRALRDTANPPDTHPQDGHPRGENLPGGHPPATALSAQFARRRITTLQGWLAALSGELPDRAAAVVSASLGRWSEFAATLASTTTAQLRYDRTRTVDAAMSGYLLRQGDLWLMLLTGTRSTAGLLSPEGYVAAGELALRRSVVIIRRILKHYWFALVIGVAALAAILSLAATYTGGAARVWTTIATIAGALGISARAIASTAARLTAEAERPVFAMAEEDVMAWAVTSMPRLRLPRQQVRQLRRAGIAPTSSLGRV